MACEYCGKADELRPYGRNGALICFACGMLPENLAETERQFDTQMNACGPVAVIGTEAGPFPLENLGVPGINKARG